MARYDVDEYIEKVEELAFLETSDFTSHVPINVGPYIENGFFETFAQGLANLCINVEIHELIQKCKEFAENNPPDWFIKSLKSRQIFQDNSFVKKYIEYISNEDNCDPLREGRILCSFYNTNLYVLKPYFSIYYIMFVIDEFGARYDNNINLSSNRNIYIADMDGIYYQTVSILNIQIKRNEPDVCKTTDGDHFYISNVQNKDNSDDVDAINIKRKQLILNGLNKLQNAIITGNIKRVIETEKFFHDNGLMDKTLIAEIYDTEKCITKNDLILLSSRKKQVHILQYLLKKSNLLYYLTKDVTDRELEHAERCEIFCSAICSEDFNILEMLYDYWSSSMHQARYNCNEESKVICDLQALGELLKIARDKCSDILVLNQQIYLNIHCLIKFNDYLISLYTELRKFRSNFNYNGNNKECEAEYARILIIHILRIHEEHSDITKIILEKSQLVDEQYVQDMLKDESSLYIKSLLYIMYEVYFRKLDFNVSIFILDNLHIIKQRLKPPDLSYQEIECTLYYYVYRVSEDWRLYLPNNRGILSKSKLAIHKSVITFIKSIHDPQKLLNGPVIFLERRHFQKSLIEFRELLQMTNTKKSIRNDNLTHDEINSLTLLPYMRDDYSLKKILYYMEAVLSVDIEQDEYFGILIIERVIQVIGEMFKSTHESFHLSHTTKALLETLVSMDTLKHLEGLRNILSHTEGGQLTKRIVIEKTKKNEFKEVKKDLEEIVYRVNTVLKMYKPIIDKSLIRKGIYLLIDRLHELPDKVQIHTSTIKMIFHGNQLYNQQVFHVMENSFLSNIWYKLKLTKQLFREVGLIQINTEQLSIKKILIEKRIMCIILGVLPKYFEIIEKKIEDIKHNNKLWSFLTFELAKFGVNLLDYPTQNEIEIVKKKLLNFKKEGQQFDDTLLPQVNSTTDVTRHWKSIKEVLRFIIEEIGIFSDNPLEIKKSRYSSYFKHEIVNNPPNCNAIISVVQLINMIKYEIREKLDEHVPEESQETSELLKFRGIENMIKLLHMEKDNKTEQFTYVYIKNKRAQLFAALINRVELLKETLEYPKKVSLKQHLLRFECDQKFRIVTEMLLIDIMNVFVACNITKILNKSCNLLTEINLRNVLNHGNPFLEVIGEALDSEDFPTELLSWATSIINDSEYIEALYSLFKENIDYETIENDRIDKLTADQVKLLVVFKNCERWQVYLKLIPKNWNKYSLNSKITQERVVDEAVQKLINAVCKCNLEDVKTFTDGANTDHMDRNGKTALHHAAIKGHTEIIKVLLENGASVNIADSKCRKRPIHYAAQNGHTESVALLLERGADTTTTDIDSKLPLSYVHRKHEKLALQLAQKLTVQTGRILHALSLALSE